MKKLLILILSLSLIYISSCKKEEPCDNIVCQNGGTCDEEGNCQCPSEFEGTNCELLANPKEIKITKIIVTDFLPTNGAAEWDDSDGPDLYIDFHSGTIPSAPNFAIASTSAIENCEPGNEYEFNVDWSMDGDEFGYSFALGDDDDGSYDNMGDHRIFLGEFLLEYRADKTTIIDLPTLSGGFIGLRLEVEWIFE